MGKAEYLEHPKDNQIGRGIHTAQGIERHVRYWRSGLDWLDNRTCANALHDTVATVFDISDVREILAASEVAEHIPNSQCDLRVVKNPATGEYTIIAVSALQGLPSQDAQISQRWIKLYCSKGFSVDAQLRWTDYGSGVKSLTVARARAESRYRDGLSYDWCTPGLAEKFSPYLGVYSTNRDKVEEISGEPSMSLIVGRAIPDPGAQVIDPFLHIYGKTREDIPDFKVAKRIIKWSTDPYKLLDSLISDR